MPVLALVLLVGPRVVESAEVEYRASGSVALLAIDEVDGPWNPYTEFNGSVVATGAVLTAAADGGPFHDRVLARGGTPDFVVAADDGTPMLTIEATSAVQDVAIESVNLIALELGNELGALQERVGVPAEDRIVTEVILQPDHATALDTARNRALTVVIAATLGGVIASTVIAERLARRAVRDWQLADDWAAIYETGVPALTGLQRQSTPITAPPRLTDWRAFAMPTGDPVIASDEPVLAPTTAMAGAETDGIRHAAVSGAAWSLIQSWGGRIASTAAFVALARTLDPSDFGVVALAVIFIDIGQMLVNRGFGASIIQRQDLTDEDLDSAFWFSLAAGGFLALICVATAGLLADAFGEPQLAMVLRVLALNWLLGALSSVPQNVLQRELRFRSLALRRLLAVVTSGAVGVALALGGAGVWSLVAMTLAQSAIGVIVLWSVAPWRPRWRLSLESLRGMRRFAASVVAVDLIRFSARRGESFLVGAAVGPIALGFYAVATRFLQLLNEVFTSTIGSVAFPVFSRLQGDIERRRRVLFSVVRMCALAAFPAFCGLVVLAPELVRATLGSRWEPSIILTQLLALYGLRFSITYFIANVVLSTGNAALELRLEIIGVIVKAAALAIGIRWGVEGVAWAVVASSYVTLPMGLWALRRTTGITARDYLANVSRPALAALTMIAAIVGMRTVLDGLGDVATLGLGVVVGAVTYIATLAVLAPNLFSEVRGFANDLRRRGARNDNEPRDSSPVMVQP